MLMEEGKFNDFGDSFFDEIFKSRPKGSTIMDFYHAYDSGKKISVEDLREWQEKLNTAGIHSRKYSNPFDKSPYNNAAGRSVSIEVNYMQYLNNLYDTPQVEVVESRAIENEKSVLDGNYDGNGHMRLYVGSMYYFIFNSPFCNKLSFPEKIQWAGDFARAYRKSMVIESVDKIAYNFRKKWGIEQRLNEFDSAMNFYEATNFWVAPINF